MLNTQEDIESWLVARIAREAKITPNQIGRDTEFARFGLDSIVIVTLVDDLEVEIGASLDPTILWEYPTIDRLTEWLVREKVAK
jgi:acyl carrier protein